jgi:DNA-binding transcriptional LysR family regulator
VVALVVPSFTAAAAIVAATDHVATLPASFVHRYGNAFGVREVTGTAPRLTVAIRLVWHDRTHDDPLMRVFRERATSVLRAERASRGDGTAARPRAKRRA